MLVSSLLERSLVPEDGAECDVTAAHLWGVCLFAVLRKVTTSWNFNFRHESSKGKGRANDSAKGCGLQVSRNCSVTDRIFS